MVWLSNILSEIGFKKYSNTVLHKYNLEAISWTEEVQGLRKVKHVCIGYHFTRNAVENGAVIVLLIPSNQNLADPLAKILAKELQNVHLDYFGRVYYVKRLARGRVGIWNGVFTIHV